MLLIWYAVPGFVQPETGEGTMRTTPHHLLYSTMCEHGIAKIATPGVSPTLLLRGRAAFLELCTTVPHDVLTQTCHEITYGTSPVKDSTPDGYTYKVGAYKLNADTETREWHDAKVYMHVTTAWAHLPIVQELADDHPALRDFLEVALEIRSALEAEALQLLRALSYHHSDFWSTFVDINGTIPRLVIRFVGYEKRPPDGDSPVMSAAAHYDKSGITMTGDESGPGLQMHLTDGSVANLEGAGGYSHVFPGLFAERITSKMPRVLRATRHGVLQMPDASVSERFSRYSTIAFVDPALPYATYASYAETHAVTA